MMQCLTNPLGLFLLVWGGAAALYFGGVHQGMFPSPSMLTVALVSLNVVAFTLGYLTWTLFRGLDRRRRIWRPLGPTAHAQTMARMLKFTLAMGMAALALEMYRVVAIASRFDTTWRDLVNDPETVSHSDRHLHQREPLPDQRDRDAAFHHEQPVLHRVRLPGRSPSHGPNMEEVSVRDRFSRRLAGHRPDPFEPLRGDLEHSVPGLRVLRREFAWTDAKNGVSHRIASNVRPTFNLRLVAPLAGVVLLFVLIDILLHKSGEYGLSSRLQGVLFHFFWYITGPLAAFNEFVTTFTGDHQWGQSMFLPLYKWLCRFDLAQEVEVNFYGEKVLVPYMSNVYTYLRNFYEDFGVLGVAVVPYVLGLAAAAIRDRARRHFQFLNLYLVLLLFILFSFYNYFLSSNQIYLQILFGFVLFRYEIPTDQQASMFRLYQDSRT